MATTTGVRLDEELDRLLSEDVAGVRARERLWCDEIVAGVGGRVILFGAGSLGRSCSACLVRDGIRPVAFCDNNPAMWGTKVDGIPVVSPDRAAASYGADGAFFVTIWGLSHRYAETCDRLKSAGCKHVYPAAPLRWKYPDELLPFFLQDLPHKVFEDAGAVRDAFQLWADDRSRAEYLAQVRYRALGDMYGLSAPDSEPSYFPDSLFTLDSGEVFIDCGAYDGDTVREVIRRTGGAFSRIVALEPDPKSFEALQRFTTSLPAHVASRISLHPYAVHSGRGQLRFNATGGESAAIATDGEFVIDAVPLDELIAGSGATVIKMDVEGAETEALEGAREVIAKHQPILAICLYHRQSDLWRIPLLIHSIHSGYRHYLRTHETDGWQTVGYAVPPERLKPAYA